MIFNQYFKEFADLCRTDITKHQKWHKPFGGIVIKKGKDKVSLFKPRIMKDVDSTI